MTKYKVLKRGMYGWKETDGMIYDLNTAKKKVQFTFPGKQFTISKSNVVDKKIVILIKEL